MERTATNANVWPQETGYTAAVPGLWPPSHKGSRNRAGRRLAASPETIKIGVEAPNAKQFGLNLNALYTRIQQLNGVEEPEELPPPSSWRLHLKNPTPVNMEEVKVMITSKTSTK